MNDRSKPNVRESQPRTFPIGVVTDVERAGVGSILNQDYYGPRGNIEPEPDRGNQGLWRADLRGLHACSAMFVYSKVIKRCGMIRGGCRGSVGLYLAVMGRAASAQEREEAGTGRQDWLWQQ